MSQFLTERRTDIFNKLKSVKNPTLQKQLILQPIEFYGKGFLSMRNANEDFIICSLCMAQVQQKYGWYTLDNVLYYATHIACRDIALESPESLS